MKDIRTKFLEKTREGVQSALKSRDMLLGHISKTIDTLDEVINLLGERLEEWYGVYFPELRVENRINYARVVAVFDKENPNPEELATIVGPDAAGKIMEASGKSLGAALKKVDLDECKTLADGLIALHDLRKRYITYQEGLAKEVCPNIAYLTGADVGAKLIAHVGSLLRLAILPASTVQVIGAEKALFKHLKNKKIPPPKHGIIFQNPKISSSPKKVRGKIARALANKIVQAARADAFTKNFIAEKLKADFELRCNEVLSQYKKQKRE